MGQSLLLMWRNVSVFKVFLRCDRICWVKNAGHRIYDYDHERKMTNDPGNEKKHNSR